MDGNQWTGDTCLYKHLNYKSLKIRTRTKFSVIQILRTKFSVIQILKRTKFSVPQILRRTKFSVPQILRRTKFSIPQIFRTKFSVPQIFWTLQYLAISLSVKNSRWAFFFSFCTHLRNVKSSFLSHCVWAAFFSFAVGMAQGVLTDHRRERSQAHFVNRQPRNATRAFGLSG